MQPQQPKIVKSGQEARDAALKGVEKVYVAVSSTLGPRSANVGITRPYGRPAVVHDGVTVAKEILPLADPFENYGAELAVEAADKTNAIGDGTTTATVLMHAIASTAHTYIAAGARPMALREGIEAAADLVVEELGKLAQPINKVEDVLRIATVSAQNPEIGKMVAEAYAELGKDGIMSVEESRGTETYLDMKVGMEFDRGFRNVNFVNDPVLGEANVTEPYILVTDHSLNSVDKLAPLMEKLVGEGVNKIVIIANEIEAQALAFLVVNHVQGKLQCLAVNAPSFGDKRIESLRDIAIVTGATFISESAGRGLDSVMKSDLGRAGRVTSTATSTLIVEGKGKKADVEQRAAEIKNLADNPDTGEFDREKLAERHAKLSSGVAILNIGANSEPEIKERKERAIDAISAAKAALAEGIVPGGGISLITASLAAAQKLQKDKRYKERDFQHGVQIVLDAAYEPFKKLLRNSGYDPGEKFAAVKDAAAGSGIDVMTGKVVNMVEKGIIDPVLVVASAMQNATSNAVMLVTTDNIITEKPKDEGEL